MSSQSLKNTVNPEKYNITQDPVERMKSHSFINSVQRIKKIDEAKRLGDRYQILKRKLEACREKRSESIENLQAQKSLMYYQDQLDQASKKLGEIESALMDHQVRHERKKQQLQEEFQAKVAKLNEKLDRDLRQLDDALEYNTRAENGRKANQYETINYFKTNISRTEDKINNNCKTKTKEELVIEKELQAMLKTFQDDQMLYELRHNVEGLEELVGESRTEEKSMKQTVIPTIPEIIPEVTTTTVNTTITTTTTKPKRVAKRPSLPAPAPAIIVEKKKEIVYPDSDDEEDEYELPFDVKLSADGVPSYSYKYLNDPEVPKYCLGFLDNGNILISPYGFEDPSYGENQEGIVPEVAFKLSEEEIISKIYWDEEYITKWINKQIQKLLVERQKQELIDRAIRNKKEMERLRRLEEDEDKILHMTEEQLADYLVSQNK